MTSKVRRRIVCSATLGAFLLSLIILTVLLWDKLVNAVKDPAAFQLLIADMGPWGRVLFVALAAVQVVLAVIPGQIFEIAGGFCFGFFEGALWSSLGISIGSAVAFWLARVLGVRVITAFYPEEKLQELFFLKENKRQILITFFVFLIPGIPKDMVAYFMGLTQMRFSVFMLISFLGRLPSLLLAVLSGTALQAQNLTMIVIVVTLILIFALVGFLLYRSYTKKRQCKNLDPRRFSDMKNVCFFGDSITRRGYWLAEIFAHLRKKGIRVWNCGVSGDNATWAIKRLYTDCLYRSPDTVVMMFGMNDVGRDLYNEGRTDAEEKKAERIEKFKSSMYTLADQIKAAGCDLILCTPTPCDEVTPGAAIPCHCNEGLARIAEIVRAMAIEWNVPCVDFFADLHPRVGTEYLTLPDRVHPTPESHHHMAQLFLKTLGFIDTVDTTPFLPMDPEAQALFDVDQKLREIHFIEWNQMYGARTSNKMTHADYIALAEQRLAAAREKDDKTQIHWYSNYLSIVENRIEYEHEVVKRTVEMAKK